MAGIGNLEGCVAPLAAIWPHRQDALRKTGLSRANSQALRASWQRSLGAGLTVYLNCASSTMGMLADARIAVRDVASELLADGAALLGRVHKTAKCCAKAKGGRGVL